MKTDSFWAAAGRVVAVAMAALIATLMVVPGARAEEKILYQFTGGADGSSPRYSLIFDRSGNLYGTTFWGGAYGAGTIFTLTQNVGGSWDESVLYSFTGGADGGYPDWGGLGFDSAGNLYGVTYGGGRYGLGTVYKLTRNADGTWTESVLHQFTGGKDGAQPRTKPVFDAQGNLYAAAAYGGAYGCGTVFEMMPGPNNLWTYRVLHQFAHKPACSPWVGLVSDKAGNLYGTARDTVLGCSSPPLECGTVFKLTPGQNNVWTYSMIHQFSGGKGGSDPVFGLVCDDAGNLYGTAARGGENSAGVLYELTPTEDKWTFQVLHQFKKSTDGAASEGLLARHYSPEHDASGSEAMLQRIAPTVGFASKSLRAG
jgi:uncharacterized repeat protein (TIGR03803 family)